MTPELVGVANASEQNEAQVNVEKRYCQNASLGEAKKQNWTKTTVYNFENYWGKIAMSPKRLCTAYIAST